ncbi:uncharacterized protein LOC110033436 isoform X2 [Phalaenopsis equestris]|uniref:uncharacterized protein LOC110033436 isoform X2 n=1 Tax=Phalaenopsis equestris TaxID=78828 RepID=UPI0009E1B353|nr:uncharacterized protein LOC110033436 isoform X2 [Phalaenopsis equestris]
MAGDAENLILEGDRLPTTSTTAPGTPLLQSSETDLDRYLRRLEVFLSFLSFHSHSSLLILLLCTFVFLLLGVAIPLSTIILTVCPHGGCDGYRIERLEISVFVFRVLLAAVSLACVSRNLYKYGIRRFLFVDQHHGQADRFQKEYVHKIQVASVVQVVGVVLLLHSAAKMSHRAQGIASVACKWHALLTCSSTDTSQGRTNSSGNLDGVQAAPHLLMNYSESDLESLDNVSGLTNTRLVSYMSTYHKRQALAMYLQTNAGGITIFGWIIDRIMMNTIFFLELTLVLFVLGKTIVFTSK